MDTNIYNPDVKVYTRIDDNMDEIIDDLVNNNTIKDLWEILHNIDNKCRFHRKLSLKVIDKQMDNN